jgi:indole-3-glycerol phosphate synthase
MTILADIIAYKKDEVRAARRAAPLSALAALARDQSPPRGFEKSLRRAGAGGFALIAEVKKASPSKGLIRADFDPAAIAAAYEAGGAACLSVLTDGPSFRGSLDDLAAAREAARLPALRKDFMIDPYQALEARAHGADAILVIMAAVEDSLAAELEAAAGDLGMDVLVEAHDRAEIDRALRLKTPLIGINNRDLRSFRTSLATTEKLAARVPGDRLLVSESGISAFADLRRLAGAGAQAFLVGETLMRQTDIRSATRALLTGPKPA